MREARNNLYVWFVPVFLVFLLLVSACGHRQSIADKRYYHLQPALNWVAPAQEPRAAPLYIPRPQALGVTGSRPILARTNNGSLVQLHHHLWIDSPRVLWQNTALDWGRRAGLWEAVYDVRPPHPAHYTLQLMLLELEKSAARAVLGVRAELFGPDKKLIYQDTFRTSQPLPDNTISGFVGVIQSLSENIWRQLDSGIRQALRAENRSHD